MTVVFYLLLFLIILNENEAKKMKLMKGWGRTRQVSIRRNVFFTCCCWSKSPKTPIHTDTHTHWSILNIHTYI